jgi:5'-3' exonuclease
MEKSEDSNLKFLASKRKPPSPPNFDDHYSEEKWKWDRVPYNPLFEKCFSVIDYRNVGWKKKYYQLFFDINIDDENDQICLQNVCKNYFEGIGFVARYYFDGDVSWYWYNPYPVCPFASDLNNYLKEITDINAIKLEKSSGLLPECLGRHMNGDRLRRFYPETFDWIAWEKVMLYSIEPKLPELDILLIRSVVDSEKDKLTEGERLRNLVI